MKLGLESLKLGFLVFGCQVFKLESSGNILSKKTEATPTNRPVQPNDRVTQQRSAERQPIDRGLLAERPPPLAGRSPHSSRAIAPKKKS